MARYDAEFCRLEVEFLRDPRYLLLKPVSVKLYLWLWGWAVHCRQEVVRVPNGEMVRFLALNTGMSVRDVQIGLDELCGEGFGLLAWLEDGGVRVVGVASKHPKLKDWNGR